MSFQTPGVYIREVSGGAKPIEAVGTSTAAFLGKGLLSAGTDEAVPVSNWRQFADRFIGSPKGDVESTPLIQAVWGFFQNGGSRCYIVDTGNDKNVVKAVQALEKEDEVRIVAAPGFTSAADYDALLSHCEKMYDRVAVLDGPAKTDKVSNLAEVATGRARAGGGDADAAGGGGNSGLGPRDSKNGFGAFYYPWIRIRDPLNPSKTVDAPPSGHIAGIYARSDAQRGVHKAPANESIYGAENVTHRLTRSEQDELNPKGVNCIRFFSDQGVVVWGARTVAKTNPEWRYLNVRRLFNMIEESIARSTKWIVFEPNDESLWKAIRRDVGAFLTLLWRDGMLFGRTPEEAFYVKCDDETNPPEVIDAGKVVTQIGIAPVKPAEFIVFEIGQSTGGTEVEE